MELTNFIAFLCREKATYFLRRINGFSFNKQDSVFTVFSSEWTAKLI